MFDIIVNGQVVAIAAESVVKLFMNALINAMPTEVSLAACAHQEPKESAAITPSPEETK